MEDDRRGIEEVGEKSLRVSGKDFESLHAVDGDFDVGEQRTLDSFRQSIDDLVRTICEQHILGRATPFPAHLIEQVSVHAVSDAEREDPGRFRIVPNHLDDRLIVSNVPVTEKHRDPQRCGRLGLDESGGGDFEASDTVDRDPSSIQFERRIITLDRGQRNRKFHRNLQILTDHEPGSAVLDLDRRGTRRDRDHLAVGRKVCEFGRGLEARPRPRLHQSGTDGFHHLGAPTPVKTLDESLGGDLVLRGCGTGFRPEHRRASRERDHVESIAVAHRFDRLCDHGLALLHREAAHRTGCVEDEDQFAATNFL